MANEKVKIYYKGAWIKGHIIDRRFEAGQWYYVIVSDLTDQLLHISSHQKDTGIYLER